MSTKNHFLGMSRLQAPRAKFSNQVFCYWLQGYFEISQNPSLNKEKMMLIKLFLQRIEENWGHFTAWLAEVIDYIESTNFDQKTIDLFCPVIQEELNKIFLHVIDPTYEENHDREKLLAIHRGENSGSQR